MAMGQWIRFEGETNGGGDAYPMGQNTSHDVRPRRFDIRSGARLDEKTDSSRLPILGSIAVVVHDKDKKYPLASVRQGPTDDILSAVKCSFGNMHQIV